MINELLEFDPSYAAAWMYQAELRLATGCYQEARELAQRALGASGGNQVVDSWGQKLLVRIDEAEGSGALAV